MTASQLQILDSIAHRVADLFSNGMDIMEATKQALIEQSNLCEEMAEQKTDRSKTAKDVITKAVYVSAILKN